ncbi:TVP38/TMEM64 family protein [Dyella caseinilytica]|uniref:TVP38/TMEM64 family membrane protein n=1 Tax=Dyella caseinilytica TaxID=1849581 RepID=A0ABX7GWG2_9GAMM|nr:VTT domain-containing protein [Dyella caseinilytica]QRN54388.1 TVP38/TMEM64 family protein [Dyella caseinilytica]GFZ93831.1 TVP38/TMEM64 family protein [Dyella caseinilytica]
MNRLRAALPLLLLIAAGIALLASGVFDRIHPEQLVAHQQEFHQHIHDNPWLSRLIYIGLLTLATCTGIPVTIVLILAGGFAFGVVEGTTYSSIGLTLGSLILFLASRYAFGAGSKHPPAIAERLHHGFERHPVVYTLFLRLVPVAPFGLITVALAWLRCSLWLFLGATWFGGTLMLAFETSIGSGLGHALSQGQQFGIGLIFDPSVMVPLGVLALLSLVPLALERLKSRWHPSTPRPDHPSDHR